LSIDSVFSHWGQAQIYEETKIAEDCIKIIFRNYGDILENTKYRSLSVTDNLMEVLNIIKEFTEKEESEKNKYEEDVYSNLHLYRFPHKKDVNSYQSPEKSEYDLEKNPEDRYLKKRRNTAILPNVEFKTKELLDLWSEEKVRNLFNPIGPTTCISNKRIYDRLSKLFLPQKHRKKRFEKTTTHSFIRKRSLQIINRHTVFTTGSNQPIRRRKKHVISL
jgi:hypothetical protein